MGSTQVQQHKFVATAGMTVEDIKKAKSATTLQKKYANAFDTDGKKGLSQKEADLFNATTFSEKKDGSVSFWTRQKDGTKKATHFKKGEAISFKSNDAAKSYVKSAPKSQKNEKLVGEIKMYTQNGTIDGSYKAQEGMTAKDVQKLNGGKKGSKEFFDFVNKLDGKQEKTLSGKDICALRDKTANKSSVAFGATMTGIATLATAACAGAVAITAGTLLPVAAPVALGLGGIFCAGMAIYSGIKTISTAKDLQKTNQYKKEHNIK